jgi:HSP20 family protein
VEVIAMANITRSSRWDPFGEMQRLTDQVLRAWGEGERRAFAPAVDIFEDDKAICVRAELPGVNANDLAISVENNVLTISGERRLERADEREGYHRIESVYGTFTRSFVLPESLMPDEVEADLSEGILTIKIPKKPEVAPKRVQVKSHGEAPKQPVGTSPKGGQPQKAEPPSTRSAQPSEYGQSTQPTQAEPSASGKASAQKASEPQK